jgi:hypothetical protein
MKVKEPKEKGICHWCLGKCKEPGISYCSVFISYLKDGAPYPKEGK